MIVVVYTYRSTRDNSHTLFVVRTLALNTVKKSLFVLLDVEFYNGKFNFVYSDHIGFSNINVGFFVLIASNRFF